MYIRHLATGAWIAGKLMSRSTGHVYSMTVLVELAARRGWRREDDGVYVDGDEHTCMRQRERESHLGESHSLTVT